jgi:hypothetical protein
LRKKLEIPVPGQSQNAALSGANGHAGNVPAAEKPPIKVATAAATSDTKGKPAR